ncbi:type VI secretion system baseplate subunit TssE [Rubrivivax sp. JA1026]|uniref:type VI secretion system baseplate subunit TssE n=1 Tax=Rubrivivax sp. JA1026 TaxID=2710888 RepID=UPI0013E95D04|nr:type VI secretion system baseplate subunit TssE [Rubrivivax sp. JA1026]
MRPPSLLERLLGDSPAEAGRSPRAAADRLRRALAHDIERLLNTRCAWPPERLQRWPRAARSVLALGMPDPAAETGDSLAARRRIAEHIRHTLCVHEPRLQGVRVQALDGRDAAFSIEAALRHGTDGSGLHFDAEVLPGSRHYAVLPAIGPRA